MKPRLIMFIKSFGKRKEGNHTYDEFYKIMYVKFFSRINVYLSRKIQIELYNQIMCFPKDVPPVPYIHMH